MEMNSIKVKENYGGYCNECGKSQGDQASIHFEINGVDYTLCKDCFRLFIGQLYLLETSIFEELITQLAKGDRNHILSLINKR